MSKFDDYIPSAGDIVEHVKRGSAEQVWWRSRVVALDGNTVVVRMCKSGRYSGKPLNEYRFRLIKGERQ